MNLNTSQNLTLPTPSYWWTINWGAIIASLVFIYALSWLVFMASSAIGMTVLDIHEINSYDNSENTLTISYALFGWYIIWAFIIYFLGGAFVGKHAGSVHNKSGTSHGLILWSCTIVIAVLLTSMGIGSLLSSAAGAIKTTASVGMNLPNSASTDKDGTFSRLPSSIQPLIGSLKKEIRTSQDGEKLKKVSEQLNTQTISDIAIALVQGDENHAKDLITSNTDLDQKQVDELIGSLINQARKIGEDIRRQAEEAREYAAAILWLMLLSYIVALIASITGAKYGVSKLAAINNENSN